MPKNSKKPGASGTAKSPEIKTLDFSKVERTFRAFVHAIQEFGESLEARRRQLEAQGGKMMVANHDEFVNFLEAVDALVDARFALGAGQHQLRKASGAQFTGKGGEA